jgi:hypothetical protein
LTIALAARLMVGGRTAMIRERTRRDAGERMGTRMNAFWYWRGPFSTSRYLVLFAAGTLFFSGELRKRIGKFQRKSMGSVNGGD